MTQTEEDSWRGVAAEDGPPAELVESGGRFADLHTAWADSLV